MQALSLRPGIAPFSISAVSCRSVPCPAQPFAASRWRKGTTLSKPTQVHPRCVVTSAARPTGTVEPALPEESSAAASGGLGPGWCMLGKWAQVVLMVNAAVFAVYIGATMALAKVPKLFQFLGDWGTRAEWLAMFGSLFALSWTLAWFVQEVLASQSVLKQQQQELKQELKKQQQELKQEQQELKQELKKQQQEGAAQYASLLAAITQDTVKQRLSDLEEGARQQQAAVTATLLARQSGSNGFFGRR